VAATYYVRTTGNDGNPGTGPAAGQAWKTLTPVNAHAFVPGDTVLFNGGDTFVGGISVQNVASTSASPVTFDSYGTGRATISSAAGTVGCYVYKMGGTIIQNLNFTGPGVATANKEGILFYNDAAGNTVYPYIRIVNCNLTGYTQGIAIGGGAGTSGYSDIRIDTCVCNANSRNGIQTYGAANYALATVYIGNCQTYSNTGVAGQSTPTGSGIELGRINGGTVEFCISYGNGASNNYTQGPIGIWCYECTGLVIQSCESYNNLSSGADGGGFDIDGGCTSCTLQYCYSHGNKGAGLALFQYSGASTFSGNIIRYCISENDQAGGIVIWSAATYSVTNSQIYNNTIYNSVAQAFRVLTGTTVTTTTVKNNIFLTTSGQSLVDYAGTTGFTFTKNNYFPMSGAFVIWWGGTSYATLAAWGQDATGLSVNPGLTSPGSGGTIYPAALTTLSAYKISSGSSPMVNAGTTVTSPGSFDFYGDALYSGAPDIGADEYYAPGLIDNCTAYWKMEEVGSAATRVDSVGGLGLAVAAGSVPSRTGKISNGPDFPGVTTNGLVYPADAGHAAIELGDIDWTISLWVYFDTLTLQYHTMTSCRTGSGYEWDVYLNNYGGPISFYFVKAAGGTMNLTSFVTPVVNTWYFVVCQYDSVNDLAKIYVDGTFKNQVSSSAPVVTTTSYLHVGIDSTDSSSPIDGCVDEFGIWKRLLSDSEITTLYNGGAGLTYPFTTDNAARNKRAMAMGFDALYRTRLMPVPDGSITVEDRYQLAGKYYIPFVAPTAPGELRPAFRTVGPFWPVIGGS
jgi:Concanavalin A-like lectin/glucanases superfamily/Right handed beta helix region